ncbi:unnamed protein product [Clonostachys rhizophaga]|uniref:Uncharacterized protein n=1 Tax=Clonostachys rhizophaga TaxID=160324 RepID=A0A9N9YLC3_9HYPO|nr:unnamed protein product [Clonostachys rhizophaga]
MYRVVGRQLGAVQLRVMAWARQYVSGDMGQPAEFDSADGGGRSLRGALFTHRRPIPIAGATGCRIKPGEAK